jgi:GTP pyrophosphokinase
MIKDAQPLSLKTEPLSSNLVDKARQLAQTLAGDHVLDTGENALAHADGVTQQLHELGADEAVQAVSYLIASWRALKDPEETTRKQFGAEIAALAADAYKLIIVQKTARVKEGLGAEQQAQHIELMRKMVLAFGQDLRVVLLRLASRLQTLRYYADSKTPVPRELAQETLDVLAPIANRLGIWQLKWELEDLAFRFLEPELYKRTATQLEEKRGEREATMAGIIASLQIALGQARIPGQVLGRRKHIYSIIKKMQGKQLDFAQVLDVRAVRVIVQEVRDCYAALDVVRNLWQVQGSSKSREATASVAVQAAELDDYIAHPKPNGYQSLHVIVTTPEGRPLEVQIRTQQMHDHAEHGIAAHWAYKEAGVKGYAGVKATSEYDAKIAVARQLISGISSASANALIAPAPDDRIYVLTPQAAIVELPQGATAIDFAYHLHTNLGHRCRGAKVDGVMVPLITPLKSGQTVEINAIKEGGPSRDWLNPELGFLASPRSRTKVRAWFNGIAQQETIAHGRALVDKLLQREGRTAVNLAELADKLGFRTPEALYEVVGKDEFSLRNIENALGIAPAQAEPADDTVVFRKAKASNDKSGVLVVGVGSLLTQLGHCCRPAPPDAISGYVTRGKGVSVHRNDCVNFKGMARAAPDRVIEVDWGAKPIDEAVYAVNIGIEASDRQGLLRDITEVFAKERLNVIGVKTQSVKDTAYMTFTVEVKRADALPRALALVSEVKGVMSARRR